MVVVLGGSELCVQSCYNHKKDVSQYNVGNVIRVTLWCTLLHHRFT